MDEHLQYHLYQFKDNTAQHPGKKHHFSHCLHGNVFLNTHEMNGARQFPSETMKKRFSGAH
ncbi:MAG: hypothetical protein CK424_00320 [Legionella sp.]|nr:MAG: hypothetical protein CK424_00320 [Legionella sp.]